MICDVNEFPPQWYSINFQSNKWCDFMVFIVTQANFFVEELFRNFSLNCNLKCHLTSFSMMHQSQANDE